MGNDTACARRHRKRCRVVSTAVRNNAALRFRLAQGKHGIVGPACLEGARALEVLALEQQPRAGGGVHLARGKDRGAVDMGRNPRMGDADIGKAGSCLHRAATVRRQRFLVNEAL